MENKIDRSKYKDIDMLCKKTKYLRHIYSYIGEEDAALVYLDEMIPENDVEILERIERVYNKMREECHEVDGSTYSLRGEILEHYQMYWAKLCVFAYFYYHDDALWQQMIIPRLMQKVASAELRDDLETAQMKIDKFYKEREAILSFSQPSAKPKENSGTTINIYGNVGNAIGNVERLNENDHD